MWLCYWIGGGAVASCHGGTRWVVADRTSCRGCARLSEPQCELLLDKREPVLSCVRLNFGAVSNLLKSDQGACT